MEVPFYCVINFLLLSLNLFFRPTSSKLVLLQSVCRHGDRAPIDVYPNYEKVEFWKYGLERLTPKGVSQCFQNGRNYWKHYKELFSSTYNPNEVVITTSRIDRTITSAEAFAAGFLEETGYLSEKDSMAVSKKTPKIMPYPVHAISEEVDYYLRVAGTTCNRLYKASQNFFQSKELTLLAARHQDFINFACEKAGYQMRNWSILDVNDIVDTTVCDKMNGKPVPEWLTDEVFANLSNIQNELRVLALNDRNMLELHAGAGPFIYLLLENIRARVNMSDEVTKFHLYYAHDTTLLGFLATLQSTAVDLKENPAYTSCINVELHQKDDQTYSVDIFFKYETDTMSMKRIVPSKCPVDASCDWEVFQETIETLAISDPEMACRPNDIVIQLNFTKSNLIVMAIGVSIFLLTLLVLVYSCGKSHQRGSGRKSHIDIQYEPMQFMDDI